jgi:hypothetical protein
VCNRRHFCRYFPTYFAGYFARFNRAFGARLRSRLRQPRTPHPDPFLKEERETGAVLRKVILAAV